MFRKLKQYLKFVLPENWTGLIPVCLIRNTKMDQNTLDQDQANVAALQAQLEQDKAKEAQDEIDLAAAQSKLASDQAEFNQNTPLTQITKDLDAMQAEAARIGEAATALADMINALRSKVQELLAPVENVV